MMMGKVCSKFKGSDIITYDTAKRFVHVHINEPKRHMFYSYQIT